MRADARSLRHEAPGGERGAAAVEFAILLPVLILIVFGITAFGIAFSKVETYISAAREGARYAAVHCEPDARACTDALIQARVQSAAVGYPIDLPGPTANRDCSLAANQGQAVTVSWVQHITIQIPLMPDLSRNVTVSGVFRCE